MIRDIGDRWRAGGSLVEISVVKILLYYEIMWWKLLYFNPLCWGLNLREKINRDKIIVFEDVMW